jgi:hypothetical protein
VLSHAGRQEDDPEREKVREYIEGGNLTANPFYLGLLVDVLRLPSAPEPPRSDTEGEHVVRVALGLLVDVFRVLSALKSPPSDGEGEHAVRVALLETWRGGLLDEKIIPKAERQRRERILDRMAEFAAARLTPQLDARSDDPATSEHEWLSDLHAAERLEVVEIDRDGRHRFKHDVLHAFFASYNRDRLLDALQSAPDAPRVQLAVVLAAAASRRQAILHGRRFCRKACERLTESHDEADERRLLRAAAAAEVANAGRFHALDEKIAKTCAEARREASPVIRRAALERVAQLCGNDVIVALWDFAGDDDYDVRWAAAQKLIERCSKPASSRRDHGGIWPAGLDAYKVLVREFDKSLTDAEVLLKEFHKSLTDAGGLSAAHDRHPEILRLKHMAWILPALRSPAKDWVDRDLNEKHRPDALLDRLIGLEQEGVSSELGLEASIAQGFKVDALTLITASDVDPAAVSVNRETVNIDKEKGQLSDAKFWYSQLNLLHAVTVRVAYGVAQGYGMPKDGKRNLTILRRSRYVRGLLQKNAHPYLRAAARLCDRAIDEVRRDFKGLRGEEGKSAARRVAEGKDVARQALGRYIWGDEGVLVSQQPAELDKGEVAQSARTDGGTGTDRSSGLVGTAIQLVADIAVLLNMNETGNAQQRQDFATKAALPYCMQQSRDRSELFDKCRGPEECNFGLCPYEPAINRPSAHREISRGFCRHQQHHATRRAARRWGSKVKTRELRELWEELEARAEM